jgi:hypothetical protein
LLIGFYHQEGEGHVTHIHDIYVDNVYCREASAAGIVVHGFPELKVHDIYFIIISQSNTEFTQSLTE